MTLNYKKHDKISLRKHQTFNEVWLQDRIAEDPSILGLGEVRLLDRERHTQGGGRLDLLLLDDDAGRRYEVEIQLGDTDPSHIIRCIEYWDSEKRRYPGYEHIAVLVAENVTSRFLNVVSLLAGSIPMIAIQLDALSIDDHLLLNFTQILDQTELRIDDTDDDGGGGQVDRSYWENKVGKDLLNLCDSILDLINQEADVKREMNYLRGYIGLQRNGVSNNFIHFGPKRTKKIVHINFRNPNARDWVERFEEAGVPAVLKKKSRLKVTVTPKEFKVHQDLISEIITETVKEHV